MVADFETVVAWFERGRDNAAKMGKHESALLWSDGMAHLVRLETERDAALKRVAEMEARVADVWREGYEAAMQASGFDDDPEWDDEGVNPYRVRP